MTVPAFLTAAAFVLQAAGASPASDTTTLVIAATTDVHGRAMAWDYERDRPAPLGLVRAATVVDSLRRAHPGRVILLDDGDLIEGNAFATYWARTPAPVHPMVDALNHMGYDAAAPGNHEFNFGFDVMRRALAGARYAVISANLVRADDGRPLFAPSVMLERGGIRVGVVGATTPGVLVWDGPHVAGHVTFTDVAAAVPPEVRRLRAAGADVTVLLVHAGLDGPSSYPDSAAPPENDAGAAIAGAPGLDVAVIGHTHREIADSLVGATLVVQPKYWAQSVAVVELAMVREAGRWRVARKHGVVIPLANVRPDSVLAAALMPAHDAARAWATRPVGRSADLMSAARARLEDTPVIDFINEVMREHAHADLSATAAFNTLGRLPAGDVSLADLTGIYPYDNTLRAVRITGAQLRAFLEQSARYYRGMGPDGPVVNDSVPGYNFDLVSGVDYELDLSRPVGRRVAQLLVHGRDVRDTDTFTLALNNYRQQGGGGFTMVASAPVVYDRNEDIRDLLAAEIARRGTIHAADYFVRNWRIRGVTPASATHTDAGVGDTGAAGGQNPVRLRILAINDFHGAMESRVAAWSNRRPVGGAAALAGMMDRLDSACGCPTLRLDAGDVMQGTAASNLTFGRSMVRIFGAMHIAASAIGNHEFDWSVDTLAARIREAPFAWLSANIREVPGRTRPAWATPMVMLHADSLRVAVIGYTTPGTTTSTNPRNVEHLGFLGAPALDSAIVAARLERPDYVVVLAHAGAFCNEANVCNGEVVHLAEALHNRPDLIVSGHTHSLVNTVVNGIPIVQARSHGTALGVVDFMRPGGGPSVRIRVETVWADREAPDTAVARVVQGALAAVDTLTRRPVATLAADLRCHGGLDCPLGELVADALRETTHADAALVNTTGVRADLPAGTVTWGEVYDVLPFGNFVVSLPVTGATLRQAIVHAVEGRDVLGTVSGLTVVVDTTARGAARLVSLRFADGRPVVDDSTYSLATFDFLADGGSGYAMLRARPYRNTGIDELDAFIALLRRLPQPIRAGAPTAPRITQRQRNPD